tara:strand:- start:139 stop:855 length:717 start_codon:yes stop_codon:yes gene_type:complete
MGDYLFKYRGQIPSILFLLIIPFIFKTDYSLFSETITQQNKLASFFISFCGIIIRFYTVGKTPGGTSGRNRKKQIAKILNTKGIYSIIRNPLYFGNYLIWLGLSVYTLNTFFTITLSFIFFAYYRKIIKTEEKYLLKKFGQKFLIWKNKTPQFFPSFSNYQKDKYTFSLKTVLKREYSSVLATVFTFFYIDTLINIKVNTDNIINENLSIALLISVILSLILRTIKKNTTILNQKGRT